jgi:SAM-dependent methyltransferase
MKQKSAIAPDFTTRAKAHWTKEQTTKLIGDKKYPILPGEAPELLRAMGLLNNDASMSADSVRKYQQVNHMLILLLPALEDLAKRHERVFVLDACCGSSFIALAVAWLLIEKWKKPCCVIGIDLNEAVIAKSRERANQLGWGESVRFVAGKVEAGAWSAALAEQFPELAAAEKPPRPHLLCALHACDTATDYALALGVAVQTDHMAVAPCCQAELAAQWSKLPVCDNPLLPVFQSPNLRRDIAASMTDALRMLLVRSKGYEVTATEFVPSAHTPKNRLLVCTRRGKFHKESQAQYAALKQSLGDATITLEGLLR